MGSSNTFVRMTMSLRSLKMFSVRYLANSLLTRGLLRASSAYRFLDKGWNTSPPWMVYWGRFPYCVE